MGVTESSGDFLRTLRLRSRARSRRLVFSEGTDPRVQHAAARAVEESLFSPALIGPEDEVRAGLGSLGVAEGSITVVDQTDPGRLTLLAEELHELRHDRGVTLAGALDLVRDPLLQASLMVRLGEADGSVSGCVRTTGDVIRAGLWGVGTDDGIRTVSSSFYMVFPPGASHGREVLTFTDAGVVPDPTPDQLCEIAVAAVRARARIVGDEPRVAFLSYSTLGSAEGPSVLLTREAVELFREAMPGVAAEGELQADAALSRSVALQKAPSSRIVGDANILVFPDLAAANIAYKLVQHLSDAQALGPILQGLRKPCNDLSRGASPEDILSVACITALMVD